MSEQNSTLDFGGYEGRDETFKAVFVGVDWGAPRGQLTALVCPRCSCVARWKARRPKKCRLCDLRFVYTASKFQPL